jgi:hypothetical protein
VIALPALSEDSWQSTCTLAIEATSRATTTNKTNKSLAGQQQTKQKT